MQTFGRCTPLVWKILQTINVFFLHICLGDECFINFHFKWGGWKGTRSFPNAIMSKRQSILGTHFTPGTQFKGNLVANGFIRLYLFENILYNFGKYINYKILIINIRYMLIYMSNCFYLGKWRIVFGRTPVCRNHHN